MKAPELTTSEYLTSSLGAVISRNPSSLPAIIFALAMPFQDIYLCDGEAVNLSYCLGK